MKPINTTHIFPAFTTGFLLFTIHISANTNEGISIMTLPVSNNAVIPTAARVFVDPTTCPSGQVPTYTNPKGGHIDCVDENGASKSELPIPVFAVGFVGCVVFGVVKAML